MVTASLDGYISVHELQVRTTCFLIWNVHDSFKCRLLNWNVDFKLTHTVHSLSSCVSPMRSCRCTDLTVPWCRAWPYTRARYVYNTGSQTLGRDPFVSHRPIWVKIPFSFPTKIKYILQKIFPSSSHKLRFCDHPLGRMFWWLISPLLTLYSSLAKIPAFFARGPNSKWHPVPSLKMNFWSRRPRIMYEDTFSYRSTMRIPNMTPF